VQRLWGKFLSKKVKKGKGKGKGKMHGHCPPKKKFNPLDPNDKTLADQFWSA